MINDVAYTYHAGKNRNPYRYHTYEGVLVQTDIRTSRWY